MCPEERRKQEDSPAEGGDGPRAPVTKERSGEGSWSEMMRLTSASAPVGQRSAGSGGERASEQLLCLGGVDPVSEVFRADIWSGSAGAPALRCLWPGACVPLQPHTEVAQRRLVVRSPNTGIHTPMDGLYLSCQPGSGIMDLIKHLDFH